MRRTGMSARKIGDHEWTSMQREGISPDREKIQARPLEYFKEFSSMWCRRCGHDWGKEPWR